MSEQSALRSPQVVAKELDISSATLRRWSDEFNDYLSAEASSDKGRSHRRYTDSDVNVLFVIKELMSQGMTYDQVRQQLNGHHAMPQRPPDESNEMKDMAAFENLNELLDDNEFDDGERALIAHSASDSPAIAFLTNTLVALSDSQKSILNSQAANRELLGVLLQDNFNLKEENSRLRERILEVEREISKSRQEEEWRREALRQELESKIASASQLATEAIATARSVDTPQIKTIEAKPGCLGMLFGRGGTQIITAPQRRKADAGRGPQLKQPGQPPQAGGYPQQAPTQQQPHHPKPMFPPE